MARKFSVGKKAFQMLFIVAVVVVISTAFYFGYYIYKKEQARREFVDLLEQDDRKKISELMLDWVDEQRDERGLYQRTIECDLESDYCVGISSNHEAPYIAAARYKLYKKYQSYKDLDRIAEDLEMYSGDQFIQQIQIEKWNCALLQHIILDEEIPDNIKDYARAICHKGIFSPARLDLLSSLSEQSTVIDDIVSGQVNMIGTAGESYPRSNLDNEFKQYAIIASEAIALNRITGSDEETDVIKKAFRKSTEIYTEETSLSSPRYFKDSSKCIYAVAALDMYYYFADEKYLTIASRFYNPEEVLQGGDLEDKVYCKFFYDRLYKEYGYEKIYLYSLDLTDDILESNFDHGGSSANIDDTKGLFSRYDNKVFYNTNYTNLFIMMYIDEEQ